MLRSNLARTIKLDGEIYRESFFPGLRSIELEEQSPRELKIFTLFAVKILTKFINQITLPSKLLQLEGFLTPAQ